MSTATQYSLTNIDHIIVKQDLKNVKSRTIFELSVESFEIRLKYGLIKFSGFFEN